MMVNRALVVAALSVLFALSSSYDMPILAPNGLKLHVIDPVADSDPITKGFFDAHVAKVQSYSNVASEILPNGVVMDASSFAEDLTVKMSPIHPLGPKVTSTLAAHSTHTVEVEPCSVSAIQVCNLATCGSPEVHTTPAPGMVALETSQFNDITKTIHFNSSWTAQFHYKPGTVKSGVYRHLFSVQKVNKTPTTYDFFIRDNEAYPNAELFIMNSFKFEGMQFATGVWNDIIVSYNHVSGEVTLYVNGATASVVATEDIFSEGDYMFNIGGHFSSSTYQGLSHSMGAGHAFNFFRVFDGATTDFAALVAAPHHHPLTKVPAGSGVNALNYEFFMNHLSVASFGNYFRLGYSYDECNV